MEARYPLLLPVAGFAAGLLLARLDTIPFSMLALLAALFLICILIRFRRWLFIAALSGLCWGSASMLLDGWRAAADPSWVGSEVAITAQIEAVQAQAVRMRLRLNDVVREDGRRLAGLADIYLYGEQRQPGYLAGQKIRLRAKLHPPSNLRNPGAFDYQSYCFDHHIALIGSARSEVETIDAQVSWLEQARARVRLQLVALDAEAHGVLRALILADRSRIPVDVEAHFAASGAAHLLAISGLHVGMVAGWIFAIVWWLLTRREGWIVHLPVRALALTAGVLAALLYATFAGWPLPTQRAVLMAAAGVLAWWIRRRNQPLNTLFAALLVILLLDPSAITSVSLWLSFAAVAALLLGPFEHGNDAQRWRLWIGGLFRVSLVAALATLPVIAYVFGRVPVYSLVANLLLVPLYGLWVLPMALAGALMAVVGGDAMAAVLLDWSGAGVQAGGAALAELSRWPAGNLWVPSFSMVVSLLYGFGLLAAIWLWHRRPLYGGGASLLVLTLYLLWIVPERAPLQPQLHVWDVGQGASASLVLPDRTTMVVDAPGRYGSRFNGGTIAAAGLRHTGIVHADVLVISHAQSDHAGGVERLLDQLRAVDELWLADVPGNREYRAMQRAMGRVLRQGGVVRWLKRGDHLRLGEAAVDVLWPPAGYTSANGNNASLVLSVSLRGRRILLPGDAEVAVESALLSQGVNAHDVVLMPHHGSRSSSSTGFVQALQPSQAIAQAGRFNRYGFPHADVVARYTQAGARVWQSGDGAVVLTLDAESIRADQFAAGEAGKRALALQWWRWPL